MLLRLSRLSFWLAAAAAAWALLAPDGRETTLTAIVGVASLTALGLWRAALHREQRLPVSARATPAPVLDETTLRDAARLLVQRAHEAESFEAALHAVAQVLRSELGANEATVHTVLGVDATHAQLCDLIESQPGFRTVPKRVRLDSAPLARALRSQRETGTAPGSVGVPVLHAGQVVAAIALGGIRLSIEPKALAGLLALARLTLSQLVLLPGANVLVVEDNVVQPDFTARMLRRLGCRVSLASGMLESLDLLHRTQFDLVLIDMQMSGMDGAEGLRCLRCGPGAAHSFLSASDIPVIALSTLGLPGDGERLRELGFDDHLFKPFRQSQMLAMLSKHLRPHAPADSKDSPAGGPVDAGDRQAAVLDATALGRLAELDPKGENHLLERVLQAFQGSVARLRPQLDAARRSGDRNAIRLVAHTLKSSSASIGAMSLSQLCAQVEDAIRLDTDAEADLSALLTALGDALDGALQAIDALLKERV